MILLLNDIWGVESFCHTPERCGVVCGALTDKGHSPGGEYPLFTYSMGEDMRCIDTIRNILQTEVLFNRDKNKSKNLFFQCSETIYFLFSAVFCVSPMRTGVLNGLFSRGCGISPAGARARAARGAQKDAFGGGDVKKWPKSLEISRYFVPLLFE